MNVSELKRALDDAGIHTRAYTLVGHALDEQYVLAAPEAGVWEVYYWERGEKNDLERFTSESAACARLLERVSADASARRDD